MHSKLEYLALYQAQKRSESGPSMLFSIPQVNHLPVGSMPPAAYLDCTSWPKQLPMNKDSQVQKLKTGHAGG